MVNRDAETLYSADVAAPVWSAAGMRNGDSDYPVATVWESRNADVQFVARLQREWLRWNPLEIIPLPFRWLFALKGQPQRMWSDAAVKLTIPAPAQRPAFDAEGSGIAVVTYARPVQR